MAMQAAIQPFIDSAISKTVNVPEDYPFEEFEIALSRGLARRAEGHHHLPAEPGARRGLVGGERGAAGPRPVRARPAHPHHRRAAGGAGGAALAAPPEARRRLARPGPTWSRRRTAASRSSSGMWRTASRSRSRSGSTASSTPRGLGGAGEEPLDGHARPGPRLAEVQARQPGAHAGRAVHRWRCRPTAGRCRSPATSAPSRRWCATAARASGSSTGRTARRRWSTRCSRGRSRSRGSTARSAGRSTS